MSARLAGRGWLRRVIVVDLPDGPHVLEYDGWGLGYETVKVDGLKIRRTGWFWFATRFPFKLGGWPASVEVRVWPWLAIRSLAVRVGDRVVHAEGVDAGGKNKANDPDGFDDLA